MRLVRGYSPDNPSFLTYAKLEFSFCFARLTSTSLLTLYLSNKLEFNIRLFNEEWASTVSLHYTDSQIFISDSSFGFRKSSHFLFKSKSSVNSFKMIHYKPKMSSHKLLTPISQSRDTFKHSNLDYLSNSKHTAKS